MKIHRLEHEFKELVKRARTTNKLNLSLRVEISCACLPITYAMDFDLIVFCTIPHGLGDHEAYDRRLVVCVLPRQAVILYNDAITAMTSLRSCESLLTCHQARIK